MPKRKDKNILFDDGEDEDIEDSVAIIDDNDDDDANEDLSLKILEKALSWRDGNKHEIWGDQDEETMVEKVVEIEGEVEKSARLNQKTGETCSNLVMKKLLRGARYFDPPDASWVTCYSCYSCGEQGHITVNCPTPTKRRKPCFICGSLEHEAKLSSKGHNCYICNKGGHRAKHCPDKYKSGSKDALCLRCGGFGHDMILCKYEYSKEDLKDIQCYVCKSFGHLCCVEPNNSPSWSVSCYICGKLGHIGLGHVCYICNKGGHRAKDCPDKYKKYKSGCKGDVCLRCGDFGHGMILCKYEYSQEDLKDIQCYVCKSFGHLCCVEPDNSKSWAVSCYICGQLGHTGLTCSRHYDETNKNDYVSVHHAISVGKQVILSVTALILAAYAFQETLGKKRLSHVNARIHRAETQSVYATNVEEKDILFEISYDSTFGYKQEFLLQYLLFILILKGQYSHCTINPEDK